MSAILADNMREPLLTLDEVAAVLRLPPARVRHLIIEGELGAIRLPTGDLRVVPKDLRIFLRARRVDGPEAA